MENSKRTVTCGELRKGDVGKNVVLNGWVSRSRDLGGLVFIQLRDRYGITQVMVGDGASDELKKIASSLKSEYCIAVAGTVAARSEKDVNPDMATGEIEVEAKEIEIFTTSQELPFSIEEVRQKDGTVVLPNEDLRLKYRYLDLRREPMQKNIILRSQVTFATREYLTSKGFLEIETPTFIKSTPEGARDYLVPSRVHPGKFYSLPQSPQLYKQLLMVSGFDKYFQIARCYRDEDARGDRQPEFTQIDMEMSFTNREEVLTTTEGMMQYIFKKTLNYELPAKFDRISWDDAFDLYGSDKPDLRFELKMQDAAFMADLSDFNAFKAGAANAAKEIERHKRSGLKALVVKNVADKYSRKMIEALESVAKINHAKGLAWMKVDAEGKFEGGISKFFAGKESEICGKLGAEKNDLLLFVSDEKWQVACVALGAVRKQLGKDLNLYNPKDEFHFAWIIDFPYFAWNEDENHWETEHHMFTLPQKKYWDTLESDPGAVKGDLYDLVLNGYELASGSMRINDPALQQRIFKIVGYSEERAQKAFGFLVQAFKFGAPPHGGIAPGLDRLVMLMRHEESIHEVIAFPKNNLAASPMDECPSVVDQQQLDDLHLKCTEIEKE
ncbi:aspartate--tRNA ligase [Treponema ruminis]|uniref:Aspartate--tRNA ligase n=1 Tax=Treponema ruminis TaxID=744515 RepID=A0A7W8LKN8_9SPIR|nr:aspartate--tRNA ligase [Treponema ruminis]MBB5224687.1 aspartyl-tRNA synthetase [Treponema ruminis]